MKLTDKEIKEMAIIIASGLDKKSTILSEYFSVDFIHNGKEYNAFGLYDIIYGFDGENYTIVETHSEVEELMCNDTDEAIENSLYDLNREIERILLT